METLQYFILVPMVYIAFAVFIIGTAVRLVKIYRAPANPTTLQIFPEKKPKWLLALYDTFLFPTVRRHKPVLWVFLLLFHAALLLLIIGHLELFREFSLFQIVPHNVFLGAGYVGLALCICLLYFLFRRFLSPVRELSVAEDYYLLILLLLTVLFGSQMDWARTWFGYSTMGPEDYQSYLLSLIYFRPEVPDNLLYAGHSFMMTLHVFFANLFFIFFPFSQSMHSFLSLPMNKLRRG